MVSKAARLAELRALRASGKSRLSTYEVEEAQELYDEVDEEGYKRVVRSRLDQDDFVVEDNGEGYADDGREEWHHERRPLYYSDSDIEHDGEPLRGKAGMRYSSPSVNLVLTDTLLAKRKREEDQEKKQKLNDGISKYFSAGPAAAASKPKVSVRSLCFHLGSLHMPCSPLLQMRMPHLSQICSVK